VLVCEAVDFVDHALQADAIDNRKRALAPREQFLGTRGDGIYDGLGIITGDVTGSDRDFRPVDGPSKQIDTLGFVLTFGAAKNPNRLVEGHSTWNYSDRLALERAAAGAEVI